MANENQFVDAAACGDLDDVKRMLSLSETEVTKEMVNAIDKDGRSALHYSCLNDDVPLLKIMLADNRTDVGLTTPKGEGIFHMAALYASLEALKILFDSKRAQKLINSQNKYGETPMHLCAGSGDKGAAKAAKLLLDAGASLTITDKWNRGPLDVARENAENALVGVFTEWLESAPADVKSKVDEISAAFVKEKNKKVEPNKHSKAQLQKTFLQLGGLNLKANLKKVEVKEKTMFSKTEGKVTNKKPTGKDLKFQGKILSKCVDFPGDVNEIRKLLADPAVDPAGTDAFGLTALHKFASWNKTELIDMLLPKLTPEQINFQDQDGKTALHWACEMASVAVVGKLVSEGNIDASLKDKKGRTAEDIVNSGEGTVIERLKKALKK
mmetsp:Transcript_4098/g.4747  ORF Transcript_4098/g.4747 Transcript_4098/m.4747 type:complete len:383 (-) Transcript_4098:163-1311(-)